MLAEMFLDEDSARRWFGERRWPNRVHRVHCGSDKVQEVDPQKRMSRRSRDRCRHFSVRMRTVMDKSKFPLHKRVFAIYLVAT